MKEVERYVDRCDICQWYKNRSKALAGKLMPNVIVMKKTISYMFINLMENIQEYNVGKI